MLAKSGTASMVSWKMQKASSYLPPTEPCLFRLAIFWLGGHFDAKHQWWGGIRSCSCGNFRKLLPIIYARSKPQANQHSSRIILRSYGLKPLLMLHKEVQCKLKPLLTPQLHKLVTSSLKERSICLVSIHRKTNLRRCPPKQRPLPYIVFFVYCWHANSRISPNCEHWWIRYSSLVKALLKEQGRWIYDLQVYGISAKSHISKICIT